MSLRSPGSLVVVWWATLWAALIACAHARGLRVGLAALTICALVATPGGAGALTPGASPSATVQVVPAARAATNVAIIEIKGPIDAITERSVKRRLQAAAKAGADAVVFDIDTPGGAAGAALEIITAIRQSPVANTVAWVNPNAYSAGALIALACREIVVADGAVMGDALPIYVSIMGLKSITDAERQKILAPLLTTVVTSARERGWDELLVQSFVSSGVELWLVESVREPGRVLAVTREEYAAIMGASPARTLPVIPGVKPAAPLWPAPSVDESPDEATAPQVPVPAPAQRGAGVSASGGGGSGGGGGGGGAATGSGFIPASPTLGRIASEVNLGLSAVSRRPAMDASQRGLWRPVERITDGNSILTLSAELLFRYRFASPSAEPKGTINTDEQLRAFFQATTVARLSESAPEVLARFFSNNAVRGVLIVIFLIAIFVEFINPGVALPGLIAVAALGMLFAPAIILGLDGWWWVLAVLGGVLCLALEIFVLPGFGVFGIVGLLLVFLGLVGVFIPGGNPFGMTGEEQSDMLRGLVTLVVAIVASATGMYFIGRNVGTLPITRNLVLVPAGGNGLADGDAAMAGAQSTVGPGGLTLSVGARGRSVTPLRPAGKARFGEDLVDVTADRGYVNADVPLRVVAVSTFRVVVEACAAEDDRAPRRAPEGTT
jgi:membrane-bound serine protease (ClpP class)